MSREFDGTSSYDWPGWSYANAPCFSAWVQLWDSGGIRGIIGSRGASSFDTWASLQTDSSDRLVFHVSNGIGWDATGATAVTLDTWHLVGGQYDGVDLSVWLDGSLDGFTTQGGMSLLGGGNKYVGVLDTALKWIGLMDNVAYWSRPLFPEEWQSLYQGTSPSRINAREFVSGGRLVSHWPLWGDYSDEPSIASDDVLIEQGTIPAADPYQHVGSPWSVAG